MRHRSSVSQRASAASRRRLGVETGRQRAEQSLEVRE
jgi:hypothetical protein